jgi:hypothetical protein
MHVCYPFTSPFLIFFPLSFSFTLSPFFSFNFHIFSPQMTLADILPGGGGGEYYPIIDTWFKKTVKVA